VGPPGIDLLQKSVTVHKVTHLGRGAVDCIETLCDGNRLICRAIRHPARVALALAGMQKPEVAEQLHTDFVKQCSHAAAIVS
jgi:hypothetical protein